MNECVKTDRLILHRHIFENGTLFAQIKQKQQHSSPQALSDLLKKNQNVLKGIFGWWIDVASPYSAGIRIHEDSRAWRHKEQLQYYVYEKETQKCIGIFCAIIKKNEAYVLAWLSQNNQGKGYAREIAKAFDKELFETVNLDKVKYECFNLNPHKSKVRSFLTDVNYKEEKITTVSTLWSKTRGEYFLGLGIKPLLIKSKKIGISFFRRMMNIFINE